MEWVSITAAFVGMWAGLGFVIFQVLKYVLGKADAEKRGEGWDEGL